MIKSPCKKKILKITVFSTFALCLFVLIVIYEYFKSRNPQMSGTLKIEGIHEQVSVIRDKFGVPHINANNRSDALKALGYIVAQERLFQMDMSRLLAKGELASLFGRSSLESDLLFRTLGLKHYSEELVKRKMLAKSFDPQMLQDCEDFFNGINQFVENGALPVEYFILGVKPQPFSMIDSLSFMGLMGYNFGIASIMDTLLTKLNKRLTTQYVEEMRIENIPPLQTSIVKQDYKVQNSVASLTLDSKLSKVLNELEDQSFLFDGSNGWLLSGKRSKNKKPILANDPHISYTMPGVWFEAHIKAPGLEEYGHFLPLIPFPVLSHNYKRAWGITMSLTDDMDLYSERVNEFNKTYEFNGQQLPLKQRQEVILIKNESPMTLTVNETHHGPIVHKVLKDQVEKTQLTSQLSSHLTSHLSLQWTFYHPENDPLSALYEMQKAQSMHDFKKAVSMGRSPGLNILYADVDNIAWWMFGTIWKKRSNLKTDNILDGASGKDEIMSELKFNEKPYEENPKSGLIVSANSRPDSYPLALRGDWQANDRYKTLLSILSSKDNWSIDELKEVQTLSINFDNKEIKNVLIHDIKPLLKNNQLLVPLVSTLEEWDLISSIDSVAPSVYYTWLNKMSLSLLRDLSDEEKENFLKSPNGWIFIKKVILQKDSIWWSKFNRDEILVNSLIETKKNLEEQLGHDMNNWQWGKIHTIEYKHPFSKISGLDYIFNLGPYPAPSAHHEVSNFKYFGTKDGFKVKAGPSTRRIIDFSNPSKSWGILPTGNSGHVLSPFYKNQVQMFLNGEYRNQFLELSPKDALFKLKILPNH